MSGDSRVFRHPFDTPISAGLRFLVELIAWISGPWAAASVSGWLVAPVLILLLGLPSVFSTPGDKRNVIVRTPGPVRVAIELLLYLVAAVAPWFVWREPLAVAAVIIVGVALAAGFPRMRWLLKGAPGEEDPER